MIVRAVIIILSFLGLANSIYFTFAYYGRVKKARWVPEILCARDGSSCVTVVQTRYARVFGVPNSLLGIVFYLAVGGWGLAGVTSAGHWLNGALIVTSAGTVALGFYLIYALRRILHIDCPLCYTAHAINAALLILLILSAR